jgi:hypothetical protein
VIVEYILKLKESLEFILNDIGIDNLSKDVIDVLRKVDNSLSRIDEENGENIQQLNSKTVSDVVNSDALKNEILSYRVDLSTGKLYKEGE